LEREAQAVERDRSTRAEAGEADCPHCEARGFVTSELVEESGEHRMAFSWCLHCEHSGRLALVRSERGYWAVAHASVATFVAGEIDAHEGIVFLGVEPPAGHRYPKPGARRKDD
jgi:hypothetical protein